jgi:ABC-type amino acid transport substrate-binding protein
MGLCRSTWQAAGVTVLALFALWPVAHGQVAERTLASEPVALRVCMAENNPPLSYKVKSEAHGLDVHVAQAIAKGLNRPLQIVFFESENDRDRNQVHETNAMLSSNVCELASSFALFAPDLSVPSRATARVPDHDGAPPRRQRPFIELKALAATRAYHASLLGVVVRDPKQRVETLADLHNLRTGVTVGTVAGTALAMYRKGILISGMRSIALREDIFAVLEAGTLDAVLAPLNRWDAYRLTHPQTVLRASGYVHPFRMHLGFASLASSAELLKSANESIAQSLQSGALQRWAEATGTTWTRPVGEEIRSSFRTADLAPE